MKQLNLRFNKQFLYVFIIVLIIIFGLFFLDHYNLSASALIVKTIIP